MALQLSKRAFFAPTLNRYSMKVPAEIACIRCGGTGYLPKYKHIIDGECFACKGAGRGPQA